MRFQDAARLRYKIPLPLILLLTLTALYLFHTLLIEQKNYTDTQELLSELQATAGDILTSPEGMGYDSATKSFSAIIKELQDYPEDNNLTKLLNNENSGLFLSTDNFLSAVKSGNNAIPKAMRKLAQSIDMVSSDISKASNSYHVKLVKYEYGILFLICILAVLQYYLVDSPMRNELIRCAD